jgi:hypothetical protein
MSKNHTEIMPRPNTGMSRFIFAAAFIVSLALFSKPVKASEGAAQKSPVQKEWTFLLFLNGNNNLDDYGAFNINQMEEVGSTTQLNMVVQWASLSANKTQRLLVQKDTDKNKVTSPIVQNMGQVDMGDYRNLVSFVKWGVENYPAKHYMIAVWNHGNGWHLMNAGGGIQTNDISYDDNTGNKITTEQLGLAMAEAAKIIGHKVDVYGSDACLMAMGEVAAEMKDSVEFFVGSEDLEPGYGWPYNTWMKRWAGNASASAKDVSVYLTEEYLKAYSGGIYGTTDVTFSAMNLFHLDALMNSVKGLSNSLANLSPTDLKTTKTAVDSTQSYYLDDYKDLGDLIVRLQGAKIQLNSDVLTAVQQSIGSLIVANGGTGMFEGSQGIAIWMPTQDYQLSAYRDRYSKLQFNQATGWLGFLDLVNK